MLSKIFKKKDKKSLSTEEPEMVYSMEPRHGHAQDVLDENGIRQVAGCLPIDPINKRFLLISSSSKQDAWVIPKGGWEQDETQKQAAMRETWEEAGIKGTITRHIGVFAEKSKSGVKAHHWVYEMEIKEVAKKFPEQKKRQRRWFTYDEAVLAVKANYIHDALSMSSLSPLLHPVAETIEKKKKKKNKGKKSDEEEDSAADDDGEKKKKKKEKNVDVEEDVNDDTDDEEKKKKKKKNKKKKEQGLIDEAISSNDEAEDTKEKKKKKDKKNKEKKSNKNDGEEIDVKEVDLDENGAPMTQNVEKKKKKNKDKKKKSENSYESDRESKTEVEVQNVGGYSN